MREIHIYEDTRGVGLCRSCDAPIEWAENVKTHKRIPFNRPIVAMRTYIESATGRVIDVVDYDVSTSHFSDCPQSKDWRRS